MDLKKCDICGNSEYSLGEIFSHLQTSDVKRICGGCEDVVNEFGNRMQIVAEQESVKAQRAILKRLNKIQAEKVKSNTFWFFSHLRSIFKKQVFESAFSVIPREPK